MVGEIAPNFSLKDQNGSIFELYKNLDKKILLVFYPKDNSMVCTKQLADYNNNIEMFNQNDIRVIAINTNSVDSHLSFCDELKLNFPMLSDISKIVSRKYNAINILGINKRKLVLIDKNKKIIFEKVNPFFNYTGTEEIISLLKQM
jgi:thioredoxin-dependent peroxiredoxin